MYKRTPTCPSVRTTSKAASTHQAREASDTDSMYSSSRVKPTGQSFSSELSTLSASSPRVFLFALKSPANTHALVQKRKSTARRVLAFGWSCSGRDHPRWISIRFLASMPKILSSTPPWLSRPSSGFDLFSSEPSNLSSLTNNGNLNAPTTPAAASIKNEHHPEHHSRTGPRRTIARRGTEIFVAVGTRIRWADLSYLKNEWEDKAERRRHQRHQKHNGQMRNGNDQDSDELEGASFRVCSLMLCNCA